MKSEGGSGDAGVVIQDCLRICINILDNSEACQRLFFEMGVGWTMRLVDFFDPMLLEQTPNSNSLDDSDIDMGSFAWFDQSGKVTCAILALESLAASMSGTPNPKHQSIVGMSVSMLLPSAAFWIGRKGPSQLANAALMLIERAVSGNPTVGMHVMQSSIKIGPSQPGKNIPSDFQDAPTFYFGWKPLPEDDRKIIYIPALLAERYIFRSSSWNCLSDMNTSSINQSSTQDVEQFNTAVPDGLSQGCLRVLEAILSSDPTVNDLTIQHLLAPPLPSPEDDGGDGSGSLESARPLCSLVLNILVENCVKILNGFANSMAGVGSNSLRADVEIAERSANVFTLFFVYGGQLAKELSTKISTGHTSIFDASGSLKNLQLQGPGQSGPLPILPFLLAMAGRISRAQVNGGAAQPLLLALLRVLASAASGCERAARQILDDPSNLFILDLATVASENAGVSTSIQVMSCLFLGACFLALPDVPASDNQDISSAPQDERLTRRSFLGMIDSRIGLTRFMEILKRPVLSQVATSPQSSASLASDIFFTKGFKAFYDSQLEQIRAGIYNHYGVSRSETDKDSAYQQVIQMQLVTIAELEEKLRNFNGGLGAPLSPVLSGEGMNAKEISSQEEKLRKEIEDMISDIEELTQTRNLVEMEMKTSLEDMRIRAETAESALHDVVIRQRQDKDEMTILKQSILDLNEEKEKLQELISQRDRKIELMEGEMSSGLSLEKSREDRIVELEARNAELKSKVWSLEAELKSSVKDVSSQSPNMQHQDDISKSLSSMITSLTSLVSTLGLEQTIQLDTNLLSDETATKTVERIDEIGRSIVLCTSEIYFTAGTCSDIAQGAGVKYLDGEEGSLCRLRSCAENLQMRLSDVLDREASLDDEVKMLESDLELQRSDLGRLQEDLSIITSLLSSKESDFASQLTAKEEEIVTLRGRIQQLESNVDESKHEAALAALRQQLEKVTRNSAQVTLEMSDMEKKYKSTTEQLESAIKERDSLKAELSEHSSQLASIIADSKASMVDIQTAHENDIQKMTSLHESKIRLLEESIESYKLLNEELQSKLVAATDAAAKATAEATALQIQSVDKNRDNNPFDSQSSNVFADSPVPSYDPFGKDSSPSSSTVVNADAIKDAEERVRQSYDAELQRLQSIIENQKQEKEDLLAQLSKATKEVTFVDPFSTHTPPPSLNQQQQNIVQESHASPFPSKFHQKPKVSDDSNPFASASKPPIAQAYDPFASPATQQMQDSANYKQAYITQSNELSRLTAESTRLANELKHKEEQYAQLLIEKAKSEGESAALRDAFNALREDMNKLQGEYDLINKEAVDLQRQMKELQREKEALAASLENEMNETKSLQSQLQTEQHRNNSQINNIDSNENSNVNINSNSNSSIKTPAKKTPVKSLVPGTPTIRGLSGSSSKELDRLHAEILQERRRLYALQEEHTDLLGLLAQQEVELKVFRETLEVEAGEKAVERANEKAQRVAIDLYGTYVSFRANEDLDNDDDEGDTEGEWRD